MRDLSRFYRVLELEPGAAPAEVKRAYRDLAKVWHPDRFPGDSELAEKAKIKVQEINEAYHAIWSSIVAPAYGRRRARAARGPSGRPDTADYIVRLDGSMVAIDKTTGQRRIITHETRNSRGGRMSDEDANGESIRVVLNWIQILDNLEPFFKDEGQFKFRSKVWTRKPNGVKVIQQTEFPEDGYWSISDHPGFNTKERLGRLLFEGEVGDELVVELFGEELDRLSDNDPLDPYRREFHGSADDWLGRYGPRDDAARGAGDDPESMTNWRVCYVIERMATA